MRGFWEIGWLSALLHFELCIWIYSIPGMSARFMGEEGVCESRGRALHFFRRAHLEV